MSDFGRDLDAWLQNPYVVLSLAMLGVVSLVLSIIFFVLQRRDGRPRYVLAHTRVISELDPRFSGLELRYRSQPIRAFTVTRFFFWNAGRGLIRGSDVAPSDGLRIVAKADVKVLDCTVRASRRPQNQVQVSSATGACSISFDYLGFKDWFEIEVLHASPARHPVDFQGVVKGLDINAYRPPLMAQLGGIWMLLAFFFFITPSLWLLQLAGRVSPALGLVVFPVAWLGPVAIIGRWTKPWTRRVPPYVGPKAHGWRSVVLGRAPPDAPE